MYTVGNGWRTRNFIQHIVIQTVVGVSISHVSVTIAVAMSSILLLIVVYAVRGWGKDGLLVGRRVFAKIVGIVPGAREAFFLRSSLMLYVSQFGCLVRCGSAHAERRATDGFMMVLSRRGGLVLEVKRVCTHDVSRRATFAEPR